ncbi:MAG: hypothetical protein V4850_29115 [Myxococcota bacterium]
MRAWIIGGVAAAGVTLAIGGLHLPEARPLLLFVTGGSCPIGAELSPEARDDARALSVASVRGQATAPSRPALGLTLGTTTRAEAETWAAGRGLTCGAETGGLRCAPAGTPGSSGSQLADEVWIELDGAERVVALVATTRDLAPADAATVFAARELELSAAGTPWKRRDADLTRTMAQQLAEYRYVDYRAQLTATNMGGRVTVRTTWQDLEG